MIRAAAIQRMPGGEQCVNVLNYAGQGLNDEPIVIQRIIDFFNTIDGYFHSSWALERVDAGTYINPQSAPVSTSENVSGLVGTAASSVPLPNQTALCLSYRANGGFGRGYRGRMYLGGFASSVAAEDPVSGTSRPSGPMMVALGNAFQTLRGPGNETQKLVVKQAGSLVMNVVADGYVDARWDTQRRRARQLARPERVLLTIS